MSILVTGANGGFGKAFLPLLRKYYNESIISTGIEEVGDCYYVRCDLTDMMAVKSLIKNIRPRLIFHLAGSFANQFETDFQVNTLSAKFIFDSILVEGLATRVVILGSAAEYGAVVESDNPISETFPCCPISIYGLTKAFQTDMATYYARTHNIDVVVARVFNLATPRLSQRLFYGRAEAMILAYKKGEITKLEFGNLDSERDYIELDKATDQLLAIAERGITGNIYNVGSGIPNKIRSILNNMLEKEDIPEDVVVEASPEVTRSKGFDVPIIYADITKISKLMDLP
jgi:nucleoside-diphosphate-sugar epimerase